MLQKTALSNGNWTEEGNYSGKSTTFGRVHVYAKAMESMGFKKGDVVPPLYALVEKDAKFTKKDDNGNEVEFQRTTAQFIFKTEDELHSATIADKMLAIGERKFLKKQLSDSGLDEKELAQLLEAAL